MPSEEYKQGYEDAKRSMAQGISRYPHPATDYEKGWNRYLQELMDQF